MFKFLVLLFIFVPIIEIGLFIKVGALFGLWPTIFIVIGTALLGASLVRQQGLSTLFSIQQKTQQGQLPAQEILEGVMLAVAGVLLVTPGFMTDTLGFVLLYQPARLVILQYLKKHVNIQGSAFSSFEQEDNYDPFRNQEKGGRTFDGEFEEKKEDDHRIH